MKRHIQQPATVDTIGANTGIGNAPFAGERERKVAPVCSDSLAETRGGSAQQGASPPDAEDARHPLRPEERFRDERVRLPAQEGAASALLREVLAGGQAAAGGWSAPSGNRTARRSC